MVTLALCAVLAQVGNPYRGMTWSNALPSYLDGAVYQRILARAMSTAGAASSAAAKSPYAATDFKPVQPRSVAQALVGSAKGVTKQQARALAEGLDAGLDSFERASRKHNVAYAMAFLLGVSLQVKTGREVSDADTEGLAAAANDELATSAQFKKLPAKQKQLLYETCIVVGALIGGMAAQADDTGDAAAKAQAKALAEQALATFEGK